MDVFERIGEVFGSVTGVVERGIRSVFGSSNEREVKRTGYVRNKDGTSLILPGSMLARINEMEQQYEKLTDAELKETATRLRRKLADGLTLDDLLPEAFAAVRESGKRFLKMRHYDVQMVGGYVLHTGRIAEMMTGEGKTLVSTLPAFLNALAGKVHIVTVNDYLAKRDMEWMGPTHIGLGLTVGAIQSNMPPHERQPAYACDITYGTNNEFGFDYLRDNMKRQKSQQVQGRLDYAIVDEIDNILIDEARTPLIISGSAEDDLEKYPEADRIARLLIKGQHFEVKEKEHTCHLTDEGIRKAEELAGVESFYTAGNMEWPHLIDNALRGHHLYHNEVNYVVEPVDGVPGVVIVDEHTGRKMYGRQWSDGLHQAVEAKERVKIKEVTQTLATITLQNYFKLYGKLSGMTGTAMTEANEFYKIYKLDVVAVPTNRPMKRINHQDVIFRTQKEKWLSVVDEIVEVHKTGRPILVGTVSIEKSEMLGAMLGRRGIKHQVLNAKYHEREAEFVAQAGRLSGVTIATNMAGRGTDIILGGNPEYLAWEVLKQRYASRLDVPKSEWDGTSAEISEREGMKVEGRKVAELGGLHVIGTDRHDARRIDLQLRGRSGRQGDPGSARFFLSLEDDLMRVFNGEFVKNMLGYLGMKDGEAIESPMVTKQIEKTQKKVEERHFESRKSLLEYDEVMDFQRKKVYGYRQRVLDGANCRQLIVEMIDRLVVDLGKRPDIGRVMNIIEAGQLDRFRHFLHPMYRWDLTAGWALHEFGVEVEPDDLKDMEKDQLVAYLSNEMERQWEQRIQEQVEECLPTGYDEIEWNWNALAGWANRKFNLNLNDRELKRVARPTENDKTDTIEVVRFITEKARTKIEKADFSLADRLLDPMFQQKQLAGWVKVQFNQEINPNEFTRIEDANSAVDTIRKMILAAYREQEIRFPVLAGFNRYMGGRGQATDREGLMQWANSRFGAGLNPETDGEQSLQQLKDRILQSSRNRLPAEELFPQIDGFLDRAYAGPKDTLTDSLPLPELVAFVESKFGVRISVEQLKHGKTQARDVVLDAVDRVFRPELGTTERFILLDVLDTAWKDHLYYMEHLRQNIGLVGYAQKDPKVEYKREGMRAFESMWDRIAEQVSGGLYRLEVQSSSDFLENVWHETEARHDAADDTYDAEQQQQQQRPTNRLPQNFQSPRQETASQGDGPMGEKKAVDPIRNFDNKVGRNDLCPCGSGKKFKKCHGA